MAEVYFDEMDTAGVSEKSLDLFPPDSYVGEVYWADLPFKERSRWMITQQVRNVCTETAYLFITTSIEGRLATALSVCIPLYFFIYIHVVCFPPLPSLPFTCWSSLMDDGYFLAQLAEDKREWSYIWSQFLKDPLWPLATYAKNFILPGMSAITMRTVTSVNFRKTLQRSQPLSSVTK